MITLQRQIIKGYGGYCVSCHNQVILDPTKLFVSLFLSLISLQIKFKNADALCLFPTEYSRIGIDLRNPIKNNSIY